MSPEEAQAEDDAVEAEVVRAEYYEQETASESSVEDRGEESEYVPSEEETDEDDIISTGGSCEDGSNEIEEGVEVVYVGTVGGSVEGTTERRPRSCVYWNSRTFRGRTVVTALCRAK